MLNGTIITEAYEPDDDLQELLEDVLYNGIVEYTQKKKISLVSDISAVQLHHTVEYENETLTGCKTVSSLGVFSSLQGDPEMASALILVLSLQFGKPTLTYEDSIEHSGNRPDYSDVTAEWYDERFVEKGVPELRLENRTGIYETNEVSLETLEERAKRWLTSK